MFYNKKNIEVASIIKKAKARAELYAVWFMKDRTMATDAFRLLEITTPVKKGNEIKEAVEVKEPIPVRPDTLARIDVSDAAQHTPYLYFANNEDSRATIAIQTYDGAHKIETKKPDAVMPKYTEILKQMEGRNEARISVNAQYLIDLLEVLKDFDPFSVVEIAMPISDSPKSPLMITTGLNSAGQKGLGLLMPINK